MLVRNDQLKVINLIILILLINIPLAQAQSESLYSLLDERKELLNQNIPWARERFSVIGELIKNEHIAFYADNQVAGIIMNNGTVEKILPNIPETATVKVITDLETLQNIRTREDFMDAWSKGMITVVFKNPVFENAANMTILTASIVSFGFFFYVTGNFYRAKKFLFSMPLIGLFKTDKETHVDNEIITDRMLFGIMGWIGKGYRQKNEHSRLLIGHSYLMKCKFISLKKINEVKIRLRYDKSKLKVDSDEFDATLPYSKTFLINTITEGLPGTQTEATDFILMDAQWKDGKNEDAIINIPIIINRNIWDGISYTSGTIIQWILGIMTAILVITGMIFNQLPEIMLLLK